MELFHFFSLYFAFVARGFKGVTALQGKPYEFNKREHIILYVLLTKVYFAFMFTQEFALLPATTLTPYGSEPPASDQLEVEGFAKLGAVLGELVHVHRVKEHAIDIGVRVHVEAFS